MKAKLYNRYERCWPPRSNIERGADFVRQALREICDMAADGITGDEPEYARLRNIYEYAQVGFWESRALICYRALEECGKLAFIPNWEIDRQGAPYPPMLGKVLDLYRKTRARIAQGEILVIGPAR